MEDRFDLYFKMMGETIGAYRDLQEIKKYLEAIKNQGHMAEQFIPLNPGGTTIQGCHYRAAVAICTGFDCPAMEIKVGPSSNWKCDREWLEKTYTKKEVNFIESKRMALLEDFKKKLN